MKIDVVSLCIPLMSVSIDTLDAPQLLSLHRPSPYVVPV